MIPPPWPWMGRWPCCMPWPMATKLENGGLYPIMRAGAAPEPDEDDGALLLAGLFAGFLSLEELGEAEAHRAKAPDLQEPAAGHALARPLPVIADRPHGSSSSWPRWFKYSTIRPL